MPGSKTYEMKFQLDATTGGSFNSAFSKAQQELSRMQQEIQRLNSVQGDISAYQKQQAAVEATARKLEVLRQKHDNIQKEIKETGQFSSDLANKELTVQQQIDKTEQKMTEQTAKLGQMGSALREAGVDTSNLTGESKRLESEMQQLQQEQEQVAEEAEKMGEGMVSAMEAASAAIAAAGIIAGLKQIADAFKECVEVAAQFEATMSTVEALSGATGMEMDELSAKAKELGATTVFSAQQAGDAMTYMGMAGWSAADMLSGMDGVMSLAAASGEDLAMVSDIVTDNLTAFGMKASDTARFADVLAAAATNSNTSVSVMGETFKNAAAIAGALGYSVEDVAVAVGLMANAGIKGSIAGTSLKNTFNGLLEGATLTGEAFGEYTFNAIQADGTMKDFGATMNELRGVFDQMTEAEKVQNAQLIAGKRGYNGLLAILNATEEDYNKLTAAINESTGAAQRMADIKLDNLQGDIALANSAMEALKTTIGEALIPELRNIVQTGTQALTWINEFAKENQGAVQAIAGLVAGLGAALVAITALSAAIKLFKALDMAAMFSNPVGQAIMLAGAVAGIVMAVDAADAAMKANRGEYYQLTAASQKQYREMQALNAEYQQITATKFQDTEETIALRARVDELTEAYEANKQTLADWRAENEDLISSVQETHDAYQDTINGIQDQSTEAQALSHRLEELASRTDLTAAEQQQMASIVDRLNASIPGLGLAYDQATGKLNKTTEAINRAAKAQARQRYEQEKIQHYNDLLVEQLRLEEQVAEAEENLAAARERLAALEGAQGPGSTQEDRQAYQEAAEAVRLYEDELAGLQGSLDSVNAELGSYEAQSDAAAGATQSLEEATGNLDLALGNLQTAYAEAYAAAKESLEGQYELWEKADTVAATSMATLQSNLQSQVDYWTNYNTNLETVKKAAEDAGIDISGIWSHLSDGSADAVNAVAGMAAEIESSADGGASALTNYVDTYQQLIDAQSEAAETIASGSEGVQAALDQVKAALEQGASDLNFGDQFRQSAQETIDAFTEQLGSADISGAMAGFTAQVSAGFSSTDFKGKGMTAGSDVGAGLEQGINSSTGRATTAATKMGTEAIKAVNAALGVASPSRLTNQSGIDTVQGFVNGVNAAAPQGASAMQRAANSAINAFRAQANSSVLYSAGANLLQGAINGIRAKTPALVAAARSAGQQAAAAYKAVSQISSPSKLFKYFGEMDILGVIKGIQGKQVEADRAFAEAGASHMEAYQEAAFSQTSGNRVAASVAQADASEIIPELTETVIIPPQLIEVLSAYRQTMRRSEPDRIQAERMDRIIDAIRATPAGDGGTSLASPIQINITISGNPSLETIDRLEEFIYSDAFEERVTEVTEQAQRDAARRRY